MIDPPDRSRDPSECDPSECDPSSRDRIEMHGRAAQLVANAAVLLARASTEAAPQHTSVPTKRGKATVYVDDKGADVVVDGASVHVRTE